MGSPASLLETHMEQCDIDKHSIASTDKSQTAHKSYEDLTDEVCQNLTHPGIPTLSTHDILAELDAEKSPDPFQVKETKRSWFLFAVCFLFQCVFGFDLFAPAVYLVYYVEAFDISVADAAWVSAIFVFTNFIVGTAASICITKFGCRVTTLFGSSVLAASLAASTLAQDITVIYLLQGIGAGAGAGFAFISMNVIIPKYFGRNRAMASCFVMTGLGVGLLVCPLAISCFIAEFGWRGSVLLQTGITLHMLPLALFFTEPAKNNPRLKPRLEISPGEDLNPAEELVVMSTNKQETIIDEKDGMEDPEDVDFVPKTVIKDKDACVKNCGCLQQLFDFSLLKNNPLFVLYCMSNLLCRICSNILITHLPNFFVTSGFSHNQAAVATSVCGACNLVARFVAGGLTAYRRLDHLAVYAAIMLLNILAPILLLNLPGFGAKVFASGIFGFAFGFDYMFVPAILVNLLGVEVLAKSMALYNILSVAFVILTVPFLAGWLFDITGSYAVAFYLGITCTALGSLLAFTVSRLHKRKKNK